MEISLRVVIMFVSNDRAKYRRVPLMDFTMFVSAELSFGAELC